MTSNHNVSICFITCHVRTAVAGHAGDQMSQVSFEEENTHKTTTANYTNIKDI